MHLPVILEIDEEPSPPHPSEESLLAMAVIAQAVADIDLYRRTKQWARRNGGRGPKGRHIGLLSRKRIARDAADFLMRRCWEPGDLGERLSHPALTPGAVRRRAAGLLRKMPELRRDRPL